MDSKKHIQININPQKNTKWPIYESINFNHWCLNSKILLVFPAGLFVVLFCYLWSYGADQRTIFLPILNSEDIVEQIPINFIVNSHENDASTTEYTLDLILNINPQNFESIGFTMATYQSKPLLISSKLTLLDSNNCSYVSTPESTLIDNKVLKLNRNGDCGQVSSETGIKALLSIKASKGYQIAAWGKKGKFTERQSIYVIAQSNEISNISPIGEIQQNHADKKWRRAELLAFMWGLDRRQANLIYGTVLIALILFFLGVHNIIGNYQVLHDKSLSIAASGTAIFFAFGSLSVVLVPPLQAPDEICHLLTYSKINRNPSLEREALEFANKGHFERIKFHANELFVPQDTLKPMTAPWAHHISDTNPYRSPLSKGEWKILGKLLPNLPFGFLIFLIRMINLTTVSLAIFVSLWFLLANLVHKAISSILIILTPPTLPFFSMHVSNYCFLISGWIIQALVTQVLYSSAKKINHFFLGMLVGAAISLQIFGGHSGISTLVFWLPTAVGILFLMPLNRNSGTKIYTTVAGLLASITVFTGIVYLTESWDGLVALIEHRLTAVSIDKVLSGGLPILLLGSISWIMVLAFVRINTTKIARCLCYVAAVGILLIILLSPIVEIPPVPDIEQGLRHQPYIGRMGYTILVLLNLLVGLGFGNIDGYTVSSFWGGFGWLDGMLPTFHIKFIKGLPTIGLAILFLYRSRMMNSKQVVHLFGIIISIAIWLVALALAYNTIMSNLHGRYLIGIYLVIIAIAYEGLWFLEPGSYKFSNIISGILGMFIVSNQIFSLTHLLVRYFG